MNLLREVRELDHAWKRQNARNSAFQVVHNFKSCYILHAKRRIDVSIEIIA